MKIKNTTAAILAAAAMTAATTAWAVDATTAWAVDAAPASVPQITENAQPQVGMSAATATAEEAYGGQTRSARLHMSREYGPVLDVRVVKDDGTNVHAFVDAQTGKVVAADEFGIGEGRHMHDGRGYGHRDHDRGDCGFGFGHGFGFHGGRACW